MNAKQIGDAGAQALAEALQNLTSLTSLTINLRFNNIKDTGAEALQKLPSLTSLTLVPLHLSKI